MKSIKIFMICSVMLLGTYLFSLQAEAAEVAEANNNLTTITVGASDDESGSLMYAIDSDDPNAFGSSNEFVVESGSSHVVYVKDAAGNISSQVVSAPIEKVGIEVTIGQDGTDSAVATASAGKTVGEAAEKGGGTVGETTITDGSSAAEKIFYTITTKNENVFYMVIDNTRSQDNVYLLNQVTEEDLLALTEGADAKKTKETLFGSSSDENTETASNTEVQEAESKKETQDKKSDLPIIILVVVIVGGVYYYLKIYKPKTAEEMDMADAMDMDEFETEEESEGNEIVFEEEEAKNRLLRKITDEAMEGEVVDLSAKNSLTEEDEEFLNKKIEDFEIEIESADNDETNTDLEEDE